MAAKKKGKGKVKIEAQDDVDTETRSFSWTLDELPSSQHKTGLVGLLLLLRWLDKKPKAKRRGVRKVSVDASSATVEIDFEGLSWLFDEAYAATSVENEYNAPFKGVEPVRVVSRDVTDAKKLDKNTGRPVTKTVKKYVYRGVQIQGAFLAEIDPGGEEGLWIKLWRDFVWGVLRAVPATRAPYNDRAGGKKSGDAEDAWIALTRDVSRSVELPSTYFVGAQAATAENVSFKDRERFQFLLHFWPFAVGIAVPTVVNRQRKTEFSGHVLCFPDVSDLALFCDEYEGALLSRSEDPLAYLPKQAVLDFPAEGGLQFLSALRARLTAAQSKQRTHDLVLGVDIIHLEREGNNVRTRSTSRIEPSDLIQDEYDRLKTSFYDPTFRRQLLLNLLAQKPWHTGFDRLFATMPMAHFLKGHAAEGSFPSQFPFDAAKQFQHHSKEQSDV